MNKNPEDNEALMFFLLNTDKINTVFTQFMDSNSIKFDECRLTHREDELNSYFALELTIMSEHYNVNLPIKKITDSFDARKVLEGNIRVKYNEGIATVYTPIVFNIEETTFMEYNFVKSLAGIEKFKL